MGIDSPFTSSSIPSKFWGDTLKINRYKKLFPDEVVALFLKEDKCKGKGELVLKAYEERILYLIDNNKCGSLLTLLENCGLDKICKLFVNLFNKKFDTSKILDQDENIFKEYKKSMCRKVDYYKIADESGIVLLKNQVEELLKLYITWLRKKGCQKFLPEIKKTTTTTKTKVTSFSLKEVLEKKTGYEILLSVKDLLGESESGEEIMILSNYEQRIYFLLNKKTEKDAENLKYLFTNFDSEAVWQLFRYFFRYGKILMSSSQNKDDFKKNESQIFSKLYAFFKKNENFKESKPENIQLVNELFKSYVSWLREMDNPQKSNPKKPNPSQKHNSSQKHTPTHRNSELNFSLPSESEIKKFGIIIPKSETGDDDHYLSENRDLITCVEVLSTSRNNFLKKLYKKNVEGGARGSIDGRGRKTIDIEKSWEFLLRKIKAKGIYEKKMKAGKLINIIFANDPNFEWEYDKDNNVIKIKDKKSELIFRYILYDIIRYPSNDLESTEEILNNLILLTEVTKLFPEITKIHLGDNGSGDRWQELLNLCEKVRQKLKEKSSSLQEKLI